MLCPACGHDVPEGNKFCGNCGAALRSAQAEDRPEADTPERDESSPGEREPAASRERDDQQGPLQVLAPTDTTDEKGEREVWKGRYSNRVALGGLILTLAVALVLGALAAFLTLRFWTKPEGRHWLDVAVWVVWGVCVLGVLVRVLWRWAKHRLTLRYRLTTERLFVEKGLFSRTRDEIELLRVDDVSVHQSIMDRLFKVGNVNVFAQTDASTYEEARQQAAKRRRKGPAEAPPDLAESKYSTLVLLGIDEPDAVKEKIRQYTRARRKRSLHIEAL